MVKRTYKPRTKAKAKGTPKAKKQKKNFDGQAKKFHGFLRDLNASKSEEE